MTSVSSSPGHRHYLHPLEAIPWLGRIPRSLPRDLLFTLILVVATTIAFSLITKLNVPTLSLWELLSINGVFSFCISYSIHFFSVVCDRILLRLFSDITHSKRMFSDLLAALVGGATGYFIAATFLGINVRFWSGVLIAMAWVVALLTGMGIAQRRRTLNELEFARERTARVDAERLMTVARLQMLQARVEPHFLFNTLANVSSLIEVEPKRARKMLDELTLLLRAALDSTRKNATSLSNELKMIEAYLGVLKVRMGDRLSYRIDAAPELLNADVPAMLLQPIVENAVKHGIEPRVKGGAVHVQAKREGAHLLLIVSDDGVGFMPNSKESVGLGAVRERLAVQFNSADALTIARTPENWTRVAIRIPMSQ
jgi:sensor histidine kinase YesM